MGIEAWPRVGRRAMALADGGGAGVKQSRSGGPEPALFPIRRARG